MTIYSFHCNYTNYFALVFLTSADPSSVFVNSSTTSSSVLAPVSLKLALSVFTPVKSLSIKSDKWAFSIFTPVKSLPLKSKPAKLAPNKLLL